MRVNVHLRSSPVKQFFSLQTFEMAHFSLLPFVHFNLDLPQP